MKKNNVGTIFFIKLLISIVITLIILIIIKASSDFKNTFYKHIYSNNISFIKLKEVYNKYIGDFDIFDKVVKTETVFNEELIYDSSEVYLDGVKLSVSSNYLVPINESGIVVFIGEKENYGNTVIIQRIDGIDEWYGNVENVNVKLYDYVSEGELLGEANDNLYLVYKKDGNVLNYEEYLK
ncbi:MAG: M23 family metallopeptidase [Firmicutes bacterium]|nr:M23 family metallopeptidase [Bacillota bacterium]